MGSAVGESPLDQTTNVPLLVWTQEKVAVAVQVPAVTALGLVRVHVPPPWLVMAIDVPGGVGSFSITLPIKVQPAGGVTVAVNLLFVPASISCAVRSTVPYAFAFAILLKAPSSMVVAMHE
jgi:hypothetical protein